MTALEQIQIPNPEKGNIILPTLEQIRLLQKKTLFVRHGPTVWSTEERLQGSTDLPLSTQGADQVLSLAAKIEPVIEIITSPMQRAVQTAQIIASEQNLNSVHLLPGLEEYSFGELEGMLISELKQMPAHETWLLNPAQYQKENNFPKNAEGFMQFMQRVSLALYQVAEYLKSNQLNGKILVVSHATVLRAVRLIAQTVINNQSTLLTKNFFFSQGKFIAIPHSQTHKIMDL